MIAGNQNASEANNLQESKDAEDLQLIPGGEDRIEDQRKSQVESKQETAELPQKFAFLNALNKDLKIQPAE